MPVKITKNKDGTYNVSTPNEVHASHTTLANAKAQERLLNALEHDPDWQPTKLRHSGKMKKF